MLISDEPSSPWSRTLRPLRGPARTLDVRKAVRRVAVEKCMVLSDSQKGIRGVNYWKDCVSQRKRARKKEDRKKKRTKRGFLFCLSLSLMIRISIDGSSWSYRSLDQSNNRTYKVNLTLLRGCRDRWVRFYSRKVIENVCKRQLTTLKPSSQWFVLAWMRQDQCCDNLNHLQGMIVFWWRKWHFPGFPLVVDHSMTDTDA